MAWLKLHWMWVVIIVFGITICVLAFVMMKGPGAPTPAETPAVLADAADAGKTPDATSASVADPATKAGTAVSAPSAPATPADASATVVFHSDDAEALAEAHKGLETTVEAVASAHAARLQSLEVRVERIEMGKNPVTTSTSAAAPVVETTDEKRIRASWISMPKSTSARYQNLRMAGKEFRLLPTDTKVFRDWIAAEESAYQKWARGVIN